MLTLGGGARDSIKSRGTEPCVFIKEGIKRRLVATAASLFFIREAATERHKTGK